LLEAAAKPGDGAPDVAKALRIGVAEPTAPVFLLDLKLRSV
jgi:hypothetical protein